MLLSIRVVLDFMCPWSFIGLKSLSLAKHKFKDLIDFHPTTILPFEFDPPGTYPKEGTDWTEYCNSFGEPKSSFLLKEKLPRAFELGRRVGIEFSMARRIVDTVDVNEVLAQLPDSLREEFALGMLSEHFEKLENPNDRRVMGKVLEPMGLDRAWIDDVLDREGKEGRNLERTRNARKVMRDGGGVPQFAVFKDGVDLCLEAEGGPYEPEYFVRIFQRSIRGGKEL